MTILAIGKLLKNQAYDKKYFRCLLQFIPSKSRDRPVASADNRRHRNGAYKKVFEVPIGTSCIPEFSQLSFPTYSETMIRGCIFLLFVCLLN